MDREEERYRMASEEREPNARRMQQIRLRAYTQRQRRIQVARVVVPLALVLLSVSATLVHYFGPASKPAAAPQVPNTLATVVVDSQGRVKPVLYEDTYPPVGDNEQIVVIPKISVYPWSGGMKGAQLLLCDDHIGIGVVSSAKKEWLFAQVQRLLDSARSEAELRRVEFGKDVVFWVAEPIVKPADLAGEAWEVVQISPHVDDLASFPEEKKRLNAEVRDHLGRLHDNMDLHAVEILSKDVCRIRATSVDL